MLWPLFSTFTCVLFTAFLAYATDYTMEELGLSSATNLRRILSEFEAGQTGDASHEDFYLRYKGLERKLEFIEIQVFTSFIVF